MPKIVPMKPIPAGIDAAFPFYSSSSSVIDMRKCFWPLDRLIADLRADEISFFGTTPIMLDHDGSYGEIVPSLAGWVSTMQRIARRLEIAVDLSLLTRLGKRIEVGTPIEMADIDRAAHLIDRCRAIFLACPVHVRKAAVVDEFIDIAIEEFGLREAA